MTARFHDLLDPLHDLIDSPELRHSQRESLRADGERLRKVDFDVRAVQGRAIAFFAANGAARFEAVELPRRVRDRAVVDA